VDPKHRANGEPGTRPESRELLLNSAIAERNRGRPELALTTLARLAERHPDFSRLHEERGHCFVALRQAALAIDAFARAVGLNPALPASWQQLAGLYRMTGQSAEAERAQRQSATLQRLPAAVVTATALFADGDSQAAEALCRRHLAEHGEDAEALRLLARIAGAGRSLDAAASLLGRVLELAPEYTAARRDYAAVLMELSRFERARDEIDRLLAAEPDDPALKTLRATATAGLGQHVEAEAAFREALRASPDDADLHVSLGHTLRSTGRVPEAIAAYRRAADLRPSFGDAYWSLANLKTYRFGDAELTQLRAALAGPDLQPLDRYHLCFALGKALEDRGEYAESFHCYALGNRLKRAESLYRAEITEENTRRQRKICTQEFFASRRGWGAPEPDPIFIVGLPRSGSTLLEQILASHSAVEGTQELIHLPQIVQRLRPRYPRALAELAAAEVRRLGRQYLAETRIYRTGKRFFLDKMPNNFRHLGLIHLMLPNARIIDARREPMACCFSNFKQLFAVGHEFTYAIADIARYYRTYLELMAHWDHVLPGRVLRVQYEDVVGDLEGSVRRLLAFCELEFEPGCLEFHRNPRLVHTASSEQVRRPLNAESLAHWRHYEPWLTPLAEALGDAVHRYREPVPAA
jgi:tetratricopeptide (TPR) repeat protein